MPASPLSFLRAGPPPPKVVLLPDGLFFGRAVPIASNATPDEVVTQVELALEAMSPFPLAQLYYGWFSAPGSDHAFVYATYRRRFTSDQTEGWTDAELVIPASAALFGGKVQPATTLVLTAADGVTAVHWDNSHVPSKVVFRPVDPEAPDDVRAHVREELLRSFGGSKTVVDLLVAPSADASHSDREMVFRSGDFVSRLPTPTASALDVRDKGELAALRAARKRDLVLWRLVIGGFIALVLLLAGEIALLAGNGWQRIRVAKLNGRAGTVQKIQESQELANSIEDLVTKRLLPLEMLTAAVGTNSERKPADIVVTQIQTSTTRGLYTLMLEVQTTTPSQVPAYKGEIQKLPEVDSVSIEPLPSQGDRSLFRLTINFKPGALKPESA
jgi:hypothetical protein